MPTGMIILLGVFAGLTIYLGLLLAFLRKASQTLKTFLSMLATGVLLFLLYDVIAQATEPLKAMIDLLHTQHAQGARLSIDIFLFVTGLLFGLIGLVHFNKYVVTRFKLSRRSIVPDTTGPVVAVSQMALASVGQAEQKQTKVLAGSIAVAAPAPTGDAPVRSKDMSPQELALVIAIGIGFHNFSEGLAIGQSATVGALQLAAVLIIGFGLHNITEGFGIAGPLAGQTVSWKFIVLVGLIGGGPTFLGTLIGIAFQSPEVFVFCLTFAAGAIIYVTAELLGVAMRFKARDIVMWGLLLGFLLGYMTDLIITYAGA